MPELPAWMEGTRRWVVLALVGLHLVAVFVAAFPSPRGGLNRRDWNQPTVQAEFETWNERLRPLGWTGTTDELQDEIYTIARSYALWHQGLHEPFDPYYRCCGTAQSWRMFVAPHRYPSRFQIRVLRGRTWYIVYQARHPEHDWMSRALDHDRMRAALFRYGWGNKYPKTYSNLGEWLARHAAVDFPEASRMQVRFGRTETPSPAETRAGTTPSVTWKRPLTFDLDKLREEAP